MFDRPIDVAAISANDHDRQHFRAGARIFQEGEPGTFAYLIEEGEVEISATNQGTPVVINTLGPGDVIGEMALIDQLNRTATATALTDTSAIPLDRSQFETKMNRADPVLYLLLRVVLKRFRWALHRILEKERTLLTGEFDFGGIDTIFIDARNEAMQQLRLERDLQEGLRNGQFVLYYQPIVDVVSGRLAGYEALIRWQHPEKGLLWPAAFIAAAEDSGLIVPIGQWVIEQACRDLVRLQSAHMASAPDRPPPFMSVNVSSRQIQHLAADDALMKTIRSAGAEPGSIKLEFTESILINTPELATKILAQLRTSGVALAIDDFGTGYSSLSYLNRFPLDVLKIDRSFVSSMRDDAGSLQIVKAIIGLSRGLGLQVVAEGIETTESLELLKELGCDYAQGFLLARPQPLEQALAAVAASSEAEPAL